MRMRNSIDHQETLAEEEGEDEERECTVTSRQHHQPLPPIPSYEGNNHTSDGGFNFTSEDFCVQPRTRRRHRSGLAGIGVNHDELDDRSGRNLSSFLET